MLSTLSRAIKVGEREVRRGVKCYGASGPLGFAFSVLKEVSA